MTSTRPTYTAKGPLDLVALAPYLIGFHPSDSVVLLTFGGSEPFHARVDLPTDLDDREAVAELLREVVRRHRVPQVALLLYTDDAELARSTGELLLEGFLDDEVQVADLLRVDDDAFHDALDPDDAGTPYDLSVHPFTASRVLEGQAVMDSREQLADTLVGSDQDEVDAVHLAALRYVEHVGDLMARGTHPEAWVHDESGWLRGILREGLQRRLWQHEVGRIIVLTQYVGLRDVAWGEIDAENAKQHVALWRDLVRRAPGTFLAPPAALLGFACWLAGEGALAWCALDRCLEADPDYSMARELSHLLQQGIAPSRWQELSA